LLGGLGYALLGTSRQLAIGPTSAISLMIADTVAAMADGDAQRYAQIASLAACMVALLCLIAWLLRLSMLVRLISDSILVGFKAGAGLTIAMTQLPSLLGVPGGGHNFFERTVLLASQLGQIHYLVFALGIVAILLLVVGEGIFPARPVGLAVVALSKFLTGLLANLPKAVLAAVVLTAVYGLIDFPAMLRMWRISRMGFYAAAIALSAVLLLGILQGILLAALASVLMLLARASRPHVAFLGRIPGTSSYSDLARHPENEPLPHVIAFRPE
jgi:MFS superfamily sulfate permease-like transporter